jgi:hypothetical protein
LNDGGRKLDALNDKDQSQADRPHGQKPMPLKPGLVMQGGGVCPSGNFDSALQMNAKDPVSTTVQQRGQDGGGGGPAYDRMAANSAAFNKVVDNRITMNRNLKWDLVLALNLDAPQWCAN